MDMTNASLAARPAGPLHRPKDRQVTAPTLDHSREEPTMNRNGFEERRRAADSYQRWFRHVECPKLTPGEWRETLDKRLPSREDLDHSRAAHHIALTLYMHAGDDNIVSDVSDLPRAALAAETRTDIGAVGRALFLLEDLGLVRPILDQITGAAMYMLLRDPPPDDIFARARQADLP